MSVESVKSYLEARGAGDLLLYSDEVSHRVEDAANLIGCNPEEIAKTVSFLVHDKAVLIVTSGDGRVDNAKFKALFGVRAKMIPFDDVERYTGHVLGGICPFGVADNVDVYLDVSLKRFDVVYTGGGDIHHTVKLTIENLEKFSNYIDWIDVCKGWRQE